MNEDSIKGHHYPTPKQLQNILKPDTSGLAVRWYDLGTQLLTVDTVGVLDVIKANHPNDTSACCNKMFIMWLELQPSATWSQLVFALTNIGMNLAAENVIKYLVKGESTNSVKNAKGTGLQSYNVMAITPAQASGEFGVLLAKIIKELSQNNEAENLESLKLLCSILSVKNDPSTLFFNKEQQEAINACNKVGTLLTKHLRHCWRWDDVSFLKRVFMSLETDQFERCFEMISQYEMKIFIKLKLKEIGEYCRQKNIVPPEGYHKMATIVANKSFCHITLEEYKQLKEFILQHCKAEPYNVCYIFISPFTVSSVGSLLLLEWFIPVAALPHMNIQKLKIYKGGNGITHALVEFTDGIAIVPASRLSGVDVMFVREGQHVEVVWNAGKKYKAEILMLGSKDICEAKQSELDVKDEEMGSKTNEKQEVKENVDPKQEGKENVAPGDPPETSEKQEIKENVDPKQERKENVAPSDPSKKRKRKRKRKRVPKNDDEISKGKEVAPSDLPETSEKQEVKDHVDPKQEGKKNVAPSDPPKKRKRKRIPKNDDEIPKGKENVPPSEIPTAKRPGRPRKEKEISDDEYAEYLHGLDCSQNEIVISCDDSDDAPPRERNSSPIHSTNGIEKVLIDTKYLNKAKKDKKVVDFKHIKVLLTGSSAAGKSSFCRLLFRLKFIPEYDSTDIVEKKQAVPVIKSRSEYENQAVAVKSLSMLKQGKEVVWLELDLKDQIRYLKSLLESDKFHDQKTPPHTPNDENYTAIGSSDDNVDKNDSNDNNDKSFIKIPQSDIDKKIIASEALSDSYTIETVKLITVVDTGGQPEYVHLLPAINSYPTITFLVHDLTKKLDDPVQVRYKKTGCEEDPEKILNYSNLDMIHLLMSFVRDSLSIEHQSEVMVPNISVPQKPYIGFVGTHYDQIKGDEVTDINKELELIVNEKNFKGVGILAPEKGIIYPVNNTTAGDSEKEDPHGKIIREQIEHFTNEIEAKILPITWMILQLTLQDLCVTHHKKYITYGEYMEIAKKSVSICDEEEINATLIYFHFIGLLLYFQNPSLCDYIIINLQWLYTNLAKVMRLSLKDVKIDDRTLRKKFDEKRLLPSKQSDCEIKLEDVSQQELECFFKILMHLKVIAIVTIDDKDFYYLPCVLSNLRMYDDKHKHLLSEPLLVQFTSGFLPRGFFCSLVVHLLNDQPEKWEHQLHRSAKNFSDLMIFRLPDKTYLYLHDKIFYLKVEVRHERKYVDAWYHFELFDVLQKYLIRVCKQLNFDHHKLQYGFLCLANENDGDHIAVIDLPEIIRNKCTRVCSRECSNVTELDESHTIWFEKIKKRNQSDDSAGTKKQDSILETRSIDQLANVSTERLLLCSSSGSETEIDVLSIKPEMWAIIKIVFPKIKAKWQYVAYFMKYTPLEVKAFKNDSNDLEGSCLNLFTDWLTTNHGITPKTWQILIDKIKIVDGLQNAAENIEEEVKTLNM